MHLNCDSPARVVARIKHGPKHWTVLPALAACNDHAQLINSAPLPAGETIQVISVPAALDKITSEQFDVICDSIKTRAELKPLVSDLGVPWEVVLAAMRIAPAPPI